MKSKFNLYFSQIIWKPKISKVKRLKSKIIRHTIPKNPRNAPKSERPWLADRGSPKVNRGQKLKTWEIAAAEQQLSEINKSSRTRNNRVEANRN